jgi:hypothetical protein
MFDLVPKSFFQQEIAKYTKSFKQSDIVNMST